ncbi:cupin domain-containing protein [Anaerovorax odorimutans]|uniref:Cupin domain-containing protein n=1 Tax=Anaerovorax odorimutans TaxID=109327 RepID=A0ABT1RSH6_9FIRM|nr:cupin domain-containing protein [Anaerovorax odorimutans]MCQ4638145.1 cupin domain-containing protein [Anaerovorax odorimutans]
MLKFNETTDKYEPIREASVIDPTVFSLEESADENGVGHLFITARGPEKNLEMSDYCVNEGDVVPYHYHEYGSEIFFVTRGSVDAVIGGKQIVVNPGDMILIRPFMPHGFEYRENGTVWHEIIQGMDLWEGLTGLDRIYENCPEKIEDAAFMRDYFKTEGRVDYLGYPYLEAPAALPEDLPGFCGKDMYYKNYLLPGIECRIKYPRWKIDNIKEVWEFILDAGKSVSWNDPYFSHELMVVRKGSAEVEIEGHEKQIAKEEDIIHIPDYTRHRITSLEPGTVLQDFNVQYDLFLMLEELDIAERQGRISDDFVKECLGRYHCPITEVSGLFCL